MRIAVVGAGWAGLSAAVCATQAGHQVQVFEAGHTLGGRARSQSLTLPDGSSLALDNGQHIMIGAYRQTLQLMQTVGVEADKVLLRLPLALQFADGSGLALPDWPSPLDALAGIARVRGWSLADKGSLMAATLGWAAAGFRCDPLLSVAQLCQRLRPNVLHGLIEPLCVSALNTPAHSASAEVFLRVLKDSLLGGSGASNLLLPKAGLGELFPDAAASWLRQRGGEVHTGCPVQGLQPAPQNNGWQLKFGASAEASVALDSPVAPDASAGKNGSQTFDAVIWATSAAVAARLLAACTDALPPAQAHRLRHWAAVAGALRYESIATVYLQADRARLPLPMLALHSDSAGPAQFVFDRGQLGGPAGLLAFVVSASTDERATLPEKVMHQARQQLGALLGPASGPDAPRVLQTVIEKRATFACTPALQRPPLQIAPGLLACGDYLAGPYPATLEGAVRSGQQAAWALAGK